MALIVSKQQQQRRRKQQEPARLLKTALIVCFILFVAGILFQTDRALFHTKTAKHRKHKKDIPHYLSPDMLVADNNNKQPNQLNSGNNLRRNEVQQQEEEGGDEEGDAGASVDTPEEEAGEPPLSRRRVAFDLQNLKDGASGTIVLETVAEWAPVGVAHFWELVGADFYTGCHFFRVLPNFVAQFGIAALPATHAAWDKNAIVDDPVVHTNAANTVTFATSGKDTRTTQLFINLHDNARLDAEGFAPIGEIVEGVEFLAQINDEHREKPKQGQIVQRGNTYLSEAFPNLTCISAVRVLDSGKDAEEA